MPGLFDILRVKGITFRNRIGVSPMCQYTSENGFATDWHLVHLGSRAVGGAGLVMMEATAVEARGRISPGDNGIWLDDHVEKLKTIAEFIERQGAIPAIQIAHAGRKASRSVPWEGDSNLEDAEGGWPVVGASAIAFSDKYRVPQALSEKEINAVTESFRSAAKRSLEAGFRLLEIHAAHGYLLHSFLSPLSNKRTDVYGGSFENRTRLLKEIIRRVWTVWPERFPLAVRLSCSDWTDGGWTSEDTVRLSGELKTEGVDIIDCSSGGNIPGVKIPLIPGYQVHFSEAIKQKVEILSAAVGLITDAKQADEIIRSGKSDFVFLAREFLRDPYWPIHAARELGLNKQAPIPKQYLRAF